LCEKWCLFKIWRKRDGGFLKLLQFEIWAPY
jgi:hypothetical protein